MANASEALIVRRFGESVKDLSIVFRNTYSSGIGNQTLTLTEDVKLGILFLNANDTRTFGNSIVSSSTGTYSTLRAATQVTGVDSSKIYCGIYIIKDMKQNGTITFVSGYFSENILIKIL